MNQEQPIWFCSENSYLPSCVGADNIPSESTSRSVTHEAKQQGLQGASSEGKSHFRHRQQRKC